MHAASIVGENEQVAARESRLHAPAHHHNHWGVDINHTPQAIVEKEDNNKGLEEAEHVFQQLRLSVAGDLARSSRATFRVRAMAFSRWTGQ